MQYLSFKNTLYIYILCIAIAFLSCQNRQNNSQKSNTTLTNSATENFKEGEDYLLFERVRVVDKVAFTEPAEAYSILLPKGWTFDGDIIWRQPGSGCDGTYNTFKARSADGSCSIEILPTKAWSWTSNEYLRQFNQSKDAISYCSQGEPMNAEQYFRNVFVPDELKNPEIIKITSNEEVIKEMQRSNDNARQELMKYGASEVNFDQSAITANVRWMDNTEGIVLCGVSISEVMIPNIYNGTYDKQVTSQAAKRIIFRYPEGQKEQAMKQLSVIMSSYRTNPSWLDAVNTFWKNIREQKHVENIGKIRMIDAQTRAMGDAAIKKGNERLSAMDADMRNWEARQSADDRMHTSFIKTIREVETYKDETGRVELSSGYDHAWSRGDGSGFIMSNNPNFNPAGVLQDQSWKEMKKVE